MYRALIRLGAASTRSVLARFLLVVVPVFLGLSTIGLSVLIERDLQGERDRLAARFGNLTARTSTILARIDLEGDRRLAEGIMSQLAADQAFLCAELRRANEPAPVALAPARLGCKGQTGTQDVAVPIRGHAGYSLHVSFSDAEIAAAQQVRELAALGAIGLGFLVAVLSAAIGFKLVVQRRLGRLLSSIRLASSLGERRAVPKPGRDELGDVIIAYNEMLSREEEREDALERSNAAFLQSEAKLKRLNDELEARVRERTEELEAARDKAEAMSRAKTDFLAHMSHEIRTPLNGILGMLELLGMTNLDGLQQRYAGIMRRSGDTLLSLVNNVLDLSKVEAGKLELDHHAFDLRQLIQDVAAVFDEQASKKGLIVRLEITPDAPLFVVGDSVRLGQVVTNLMGNALKFTSTGSIGLSLELVEAGRDVLTARISVSDSGIGIPPEHQGRIFEAFEQADRSTTRQFGGTGLGLAISKQIIEAMGGTIALTSVVGEGSRFSVTLSLPPADQATKGVAPCAPQPSGTTLPGLRCLLVEDNDVNRIVAGTILESLGVTFDEAENGRVAVERALSKRYDVILMDCQMPEMDGYEATRRIRAHETAGGTARTPIIALTANVMTSDIEKCVAAGMDGHTPKPVNRQRLSEVLSRFARSGLASPNAAPTAVGAPAPAPTACLDLTALDALRAIKTPGPVPLVERAANAYFSSAPGLHRDLVKSLDTGEIEIARRAAHTLKSSSAYLGLVEVSRLARSIEEHCKAGQADSVGPLIAPLAQAMAEGEQALRAALAMSNPSAAA